MKKILASFALLSCLIMAEGGNQQLDSNVQTNQVQQQLNLSNEQKAALDSLNREQQQIAKTYQEEIELLDAEIISLLDQESINWDRVEELIHNRYAKTADINISYLKYEIKAQEIYKTNNL